MPTRNPELLANASSSYPRSVMHQSIRWHGGKKLHSKIAPSGALREFQSPNPDPVGTDLCQIIVGLLRKPGCCAAAENLGKTHGHLRRYPALPVDQFRQRGAGDSEGGSGLRDSQAQRLNALAQHKATRMGRILNRHVQSPSVTVHRNALRNARHDKTLISVVLNRWS